MSKHKNDKPIDWVGIERDYRAGVMGIREIARWYGVSDTAIHKRAKADGWTRKEAPKGPFQELREQRAVSIEIIPPASVKPEDLSDRGRAIAARMMDELEAVTAHVGDLEDMICDEESDPRRRQALLKAISLGERASTLKNLSTAIKTLNEAATPEGKKAQKQAAAEKVGGRFAAPSAPKLVVSNK
ncbi:hypothetical protein JJB09_18550 [Rhizobium sp. KVB221]|uniref:Terminase n=1 Tax=Rhizobium setariae TaxID=2801340 RepID=A0A936YVT6_9HYPH|nr:hypothetical protein [Rhizobium setariae]MBL0374025.1 hypothetical protein [Rhizobium setariae]